MMRLKKILPIVLLIVLAGWGIEYWLDKPYCTLELLESHTKKEKKNPIVYAMSKVTAQRRELQGNDPYRLYLRVEDPDGVESVQLTVSGKPIPLDKIDRAKPLQQEIQGVAEFGFHKYVLTVTDSKGNHAKAEAHIKVTASGGGFVPI